MLLEVESEKTTKMANVGLRLKRRTENKIKSMIRNVCQVCGKSHFFALETEKRRIKIRIQKLGKDSPKMKIINQIRNGDKDQKSD